MPPIPPFRKPAQSDSNAPPRPTRTSSSLNDRFGSNCVNGAFEFRRPRADSSRSGHLTRTRTGTAGSASHFTPTSPGEAANLPGVLIPRDRASAEWLPHRRRARRSVRPRIIRENAQVRSIQTHHRDLTIGKESRPGRCSRSPLPRIVFSRQRWRRRTLQERLRVLRRAHCRGLRPVLSPARSMAMLARLCSGSPTPQLTPSHFRCGWRWVKQTYAANSCPDESIQSWAISPPLADIDLPESIPVPQR
jgi:hypothetical protein